MLACKDGNCNAMKAPNILLAYNRRPSHSSFHATQINDTPERTKLSAGMPDSRATLVVVPPHLTVVERGAAPDDLRALGDDSPRCTKASYGTHRFTQVFSRT